jgi:hypothetical protein
MDDLYDMVKDNPAFQKKKGADLHASSLSWLGHVTAQIAIEGDQRNQHS